MRFRLTILMLLAAVVPVLAQTGVRGTLVDGQSGRPIANANILLTDQEIFVMSGSDGSFQITNAQPGTDVLHVIAFGFDDLYYDVDIIEGLVRDLGQLPMAVSGYDTSLLDSENYIFDEEQINADDGASQNVGTIQGATDDIFYQAASYRFSIKRYRFRGLNNNWQQGYINGIAWNDPMRGQFNYSGLGGMTSSAFRNRTTDIGLTSANYGYGSLGGSNLYTTYASEYAPGFRGNLTYTNGNTMLRAMLQYNTGVTRDGWAFSASVIGRYTPEGVTYQKGLWYNSFGYALSLEKIFNDQHRLNLTTWGAPTERANANAVTQEAYDLAGYTYNPDWGYLNGKKISDRVVKSFDPSVTLNWIWTPKMGTTLNTALGFRHNAYERTTLDWFGAADPRPTYYKNMPSYFKPTADPNGSEFDQELYAAQMEVYDYYVEQWKNNESVRQINWDAMYQANLLNYDWNDYDSTADGIGRSSYVLGSDHSNITSYMLNSYLNHRFNDIITLQGGVSFNYSNSHYYRTMKDLLGGAYWIDIDNFSVRDFAGDQDKLQNDMRNPDRKIEVGDIYGYNYNIHSLQPRIWLQNEIVTHHWNVNYGLEASYLSFYRYGQMQNGRAPENSYGKGKTHDFFTASGKVGVTYKINGRNYFTGHASMGNRAPMINDAYINARIKDTATPGIKAERYFSADLSYTWNYPRFRGSVTGFWTELWNGMQNRFFYDYDLQTMMAYSMSDVHTSYKGIEIGMEYKIYTGLSVSAAVLVSDYLYRNNPTGTRSANNGAMDDVTRTTYLKNYHVGGTPQQIYSLALNYNISGWFFEVNGSYYADGYVDLAPTRHEEMPGLWRKASSLEEYRQLQEEIAYQDKLKNAFVMNLSIGKVLYTKFGSVNFNLALNNLLNNRKIQTGGFQESKFDYTDYTTTKFPNRYWYAQGIYVSFNVGIRF